MRDETYQFGFVTKQMAYSKGMIEESLMKDPFAKVQTGKMKPLGLVITIKHLDLKEEEDLKEVAVNSDLYFIYFNHF